MWDILVRAPLGRNNQRKFVTFLTTVLVACFVYIFATAPPAYAADAAWENSFIVYEGDSYEGEFVAKPGDGTGLADGTKYYLYVEPSAPNVVTRKAHVIYFAPGADPPTETSAKIAEYTSERGKLSDKKNEKTISIEPDANASSSTNPGTTSCAIEGIGWIVCPVTNFLAKGMDVIYGYIDGFLEVRPLATTQDQAMYRAWSYMRDFANVLFVIGFLIIVYAQITGGVISNYTIKKILPRVVIAAILVNISYWICALAIDFFNILGYSVQDLFIQMRNTLVGSEGNSWQVINVESLTALILSGGTIVAGGGIAAFLGITTAAGVIAGGGIGGLVILLVPLLLGLLFIVLMTFLILAARQAIITILVIISPLAFVAYLLPNTEKWFDKWRDTFITLLFVFPAFSVVFAGAQLASAVIIQNAKDVNTILLALAVQLAPLAITPLLLKLGGGVLNRFAGVVNNPSKGIFDRGKNWARDRTEANKSAGLAELARRAKDRGFAGGRTSGNNGRRNSSGMHPYNMAFNRDQRRREREGMKAANESMSDGLFTQTARGRRVYDRNEDASSEKHFGENQNFRDYKQAMATGNDAQNTYRRDLHHQAHVAKGIGDVYEDSMTKHAEEDLQVTIRDTPNLLAVKNATAVHAGLADEAKKIIDAQGQLELQETILATDALRLQAQRTHEYQGRASQASELVEDESKAAWEQLTLDDRQIYSRQLERQANAKQLKATKDEWESILVEASAGRTDDYQRRHGPITLEVDESITRIQGAEETSAVEVKRKANAEYVMKTNLTKELKANDALLERAAGIDEYGKTKVVAQLYKEGSALHMQNVEAVESTFTNEGYDPLELIKVYQNRTLRGGEPATDMHVHAAVRQLALEKGNNTSLQKMTDFMADQGMVYDAATETYTDQAGASLDDDEVARRRDLQQIFVDALDKSGQNVTHISGTDRSAMQTGTYSAGTKKAIFRDIATGKIKADRIGKMDIDEMMRSLQVFRDSPGELNSIDNENRLAYLDVINTAMTDPIIGAKLETRHRRALEAMKLYIDPSATPPATQAELERIAGRLIPTQYDPLTIVDTI